MSTSPNPIFPVAINVGVGQILNADGTTTKTIFTAGANGSKVESLTISSTDTVDQDISLYVSRGGTDYLLALMKIPATSGSVNNVPAISGLINTQLPGLSQDANGNVILYLQNGDKLSFAAATTITSGKAITAVAVGGDY
jgi:hypothetical protein